MAAPSTDWTLIRITGHLRDFSANELTGTCTFTPNIEHAESDATNMFVVGSTLTATFAAGILKDAALNSYIDVPASNDPDIDPSGWTYRVVITTPLKTISWDCVIPIAAPGGTLDLTDLTPVVAVGAVTSYVLHSEFDVLASAQVNILDYAPVSPDTDWGAACQRAIDALPGTGGVVFIPPSDTTYTFTTAPVLRVGISIRGGGRNSTRITSSAGGFRWATYLYRFNISDLSFTTTAGGHMFTNTTGSAVVTGSTFRRCMLIQNDPNGAIMYLTGAAVNYINVEVENCDLTRAATATVPGWYLKSGYDGINGNTWRSIVASSANCDTTPFFHIEGYGSGTQHFCYDNHFVDIVGEQNVGGLIRALSVRNMVIENVRDWDGNANSTGDTIHIGKSVINSQYCRVANVGPASQTLGAGVYHINIVPGEASNCIVEHPNRIIPGVTMNLATDTLVIMDGQVTAPSGFKTGASGATKWSAGSGTPEGAVTGAVGDLWSRTNGAAGTSLYVKQSGSGNTGWTSSLGTPADVQVFTANGTWTKPTGAVMVYAQLFGCGGGGGSGRRGAAGTVRCGGGAGGAGGVVQAWIAASTLGATQAVVVGAAGTAGAAVTANDTSGNAGGAGGACTFGPYKAFGGGGGSGGTAASGPGGGGAAGSQIGGTGASASTTGTVGGTSAISSASTGGGAGGGITSGDVAGNGGAANACYASPSNNATAGGVVDSTVPGTAVSAAANSPLPGNGGGGGAASITTTAQTGTVGGNYGAGAGGGGASLNGNNSGAGAAGGAGIVVITTLF